MNDGERQRLRQLLLEQRWAALSTLDDDGRPAVSFVAYVAETDLSGLLIHVSRLAAHTRHLLARPQVALGVTTPDSGRDDPQLLVRANIRGTVSPIARGTPAYETARAHYLARLPQAEQLFGFEDFVLLRLCPEELRYVGGFAKAYTLAGEELRRLAQP